MKLKIISIYAILLMSGILMGCELAEDTSDPKLYWFIPDGMRADPDLFNIFQWAEEGKLPNIKRMMDQGSYGFSIPTFPSHTPTNFATLFTGTLPQKHGVADGPMHIEGRPLNKVSVGGFNSAAKKVEPIWITLENQGKDVFLLSIPGSTPPELEQGTTVRGRWGGWGADFHATNFEDDQGQRFNQGRGKRLFFFGPELTLYPESTDADEQFAESFSKAKWISLEKYGAKIYAYLYDSSNDNKINYDRIAFSHDKEDLIADLKQGEWSAWLPIVLDWKVNDKVVKVDTFVKIKIIKINDDGFYRIRFFYNNLNKHITKPAEIADQLVEGAGPMVDFVDNFPPQLIFYDPEDKETFLEEAEMSFDWHKAATSFILDNYDPDIFISDIYSPNQMLTSRWWMGYIDPSSSRYNSVSDEEREKLWDEVEHMYTKLDDIVGEFLDNSDKNTYFVLSSDHGAVPLDKWVRLNNLFARKGWLKFTVDKVSGEPVIDWDNSKVIYLKMAHVYIHPEGLGGDWTRASGDEYEKLREEVRNSLLELDDNGVKPVVVAYDWADAPKFLDLPTDRVGDLVIVNKAGYGWNEEMTSDKNIFDLPLKTGYKQAILADETKGMWTPFIIMGPGVKKGYALENPINSEDQYPTIMTLLNKDFATDVDGIVLNQIFR